VRRLFAWIKEGPLRLPIRWPGWGNELPYAAPYALQQMEKGMPPVEGMPSRWLSWLKPITMAAAEVNPLITGRGKEVQPESPSGRFPGPA